MKVAIDSYCYHRYFGEVYPDLEQAPQYRMSVSDFLARARGFDVQGVSIEHFMVDEQTAENPAQLRDDIGGFELVWAWGHPHGLGSGKLPAALDELKRNVNLATMLGADVMRICAGGRRTRPASWEKHRNGVVPLLEEAADYASRKCVTLAVENHIDLTGAELLESSTP
jgi:sugar phosphate isomerase/epimerase